MLIEISFKAFKDDIPKSFAVDLVLFQTELSLIIC